MRTHARTCTHTHARRYAQAHGDIDIVADTDQATYCYPLLATNNHGWLSIYVVIVTPLS